MSTSSRPRRAGARVSAAALAALTATGAALITAPAAVAQEPDVLIHRVGPDEFDDPTEYSGDVCDFYLAAFDFATARKINWRIDNEPPGANPVPVVTGSIALDAGSGYTPPVMPSGQVRLPEGEYRLTWVIDETPDNTTDDQVTLGEGTDRTFTVNCPPLAPNGGPPAGGGGLAMTQDFTPVAGAAAVGLAAGGGVFYLRLRRRRPDGAA
nr:hypothetical protein [Streptomyces tailanensis]